MTLSIVFSGVAWYKKTLTRTSLELTTQDVVSPFRYI